MWRFYLDISIDLMIMGRVDAHLLGLFKGFNEKSDADSSHFDLFCSPLLFLVKDEDRIDNRRRNERTHCDVQLF